VKSRASGARSATSSGSHGAAGGVALILDR
jgi:hypothetical protein